MASVGRLAVLTLVLAALLALSAPEDASAHGGQFQPPPPPTPGGAQPRSRPRANTPTQVDPGMGGPVVTPGGGVIQPKIVGRRKTPFTPTYEVSWRLWWDLHRDAFLPERPSAILRAVVTPEGSAPVDARARWVKARDARVKEEVEPFLRGLLDPAKEQPDDVRASAALALGKVATDPAAIELLLRWVLDDDAPDVVRESAALALGLLRRTETGRQFGAERLEPLRAKLLQVFDRHVDGRRRTIPERTRLFAMVAMGLLGDQPFGRGPVVEHGKLLSEFIWQRFRNAYYDDADYRVVLVTTMGLMPREGLTPEMMSDLEKVAAWGKLRKRGHRVREHANALTAVSRLGDSTMVSSLIRNFGAKRSGKNPPARSIAAALALADRADALATNERLLVARVLQRAMTTEQEYLVMGLLNLALGRQVGADLAAGSDRVLCSTKAADLLVERASKGPWYMRGFGVLALALAVHDRKADTDAAKALHARTAGLLRAVLRDRSLQHDLRAAAAVGLGLAGVSEAVGDLVAIVGSSSAHYDLRASAALALGQIGVQTPEVEEALGQAATEEGAEELRASAALGLSLLGSGSAASTLIQQLRDGRRTSHLAGVTTALGHLGDLDAVGPLMEVAGDPARPELVRAFALVALGVLADPEERPSLLRLKRGAPYPLRTVALEELFTIL